MTISINDIRSDKPGILTLTQRTESHPPIGYTLLDQVYLQINNEQVLVNLNELRKAVQALS